MGVKLVRHKIQEMDGFVRCSSDEYRPVQSEMEHVRLLIKKIHEELGELIEAEDEGFPAGIRDEGCDLIDAVETLVFLRTGMTPSQLQEKIADKRERRGGFYQGLVWVHP